MPPSGLRWILPSIVPVALSGCSQGLFDPRGPIAAAQKIILYDSLGIMLAIIIPTIIATFGVAWWYRASNKRARYQPDWQYSGRVEMVVWSIPAMTVLLLGGICWTGSHLLDPTKPIPSSTKPLRVQVVALDWKWLFILPDQEIASVNRVVVPSATPLALELTSSGVMNGFMVPQLGGQIAVMARMMTRLHLQADQPGTFRGVATQFSGDGFAQMGFAVEAVPADQFAQWVAATRGKGPSLDEKSYAALVEPSERVSPYTYGAVSPGLFQKILSPEISSATPTHGKHSTTPGED
jgi:cytochrome o ubiquinol oxidase subunit II